MMFFTPVREASKCTQIGTMLAAVVILVQELHMKRLDEMAL
jgi:hypothetical protein